MFTRHEAGRDAPSGVDFSLGLIDGRSRLADSPCCDTYTTAGEEAGGAAELGRWDTRAITELLAGRAASGPCGDAHTITTGEAGGTACTSGISQAGVASLKVSSCRFDK